MAILHLDVNKIIAIKNEERFQVGRVLPKLNIIGENLSIYTNLANEIVDPNNK